MEELIKRLERVIQTGAPDKDGQHPISAETVLEVVRGLSELGTNLAQVGTDCSEFPNNSDAISRQAAIDLWEKYHPTIAVDAMQYDAELRQLPPILPDKDKVSNLLYHIYSIQSPHLDMNGVVAKKYYCQELWKELFGKESELPIWMK